MPNSFLWVWFNCAPLYNYLVMLSNKIVFFIFQISLTVTRGSDSLMTQRVNEWRVTQYEWVTFKAIFVCGSVFVWQCLPRLPVNACVQLCVKLASSSRVMNQIKHTQPHTVTADQTYTYTLPALGWTEGPWPSVTLILATASAPALLFGFSSVSPAPLDTCPGLMLHFS